LNVHAYNIVRYQINSMVDVSRPLYGQLQKLTDTENSNCNVSATQPTQSSKVSKSFVFVAQLFSSPASVCLCVSASVCLSVCYGL